MLKSNMIHKCMCVVVIGFFSQIPDRVIDGYAADVTEVTRIKEQTLLLKCPLQPTNESDNDDVTVFWFHNNQPLNTTTSTPWDINGVAEPNITGKIVTEQNGLVLVIEEASGNYTCRYVNSPDNETAIHHFVVTVTDNDDDNLLSCGPPQDVVNGFYIGDNFTYGQTIIYECEFGFDMINGTSVHTCQTDGKWDGETPFCLPEDILETTQPPTTTAQPDAEEQDSHNNVQSSKSQSNFQSFFLQLKENWKQVENDLNRLKESSTSTQFKMERRIHQKLDSLGEVYKGFQKQTEYQIQLLSKQQDEQQQWAENELKALKASMTSSHTRMENTGIGQIKALQGNHRSDVVKMDSKLRQLETRIESAKAQLETENIAFLESKLNNLQTFSELTASTLISTIQTVMKLKLMSPKIINNRTVHELLWTLDNFQERRKERVIFNHFYTAVPGYHLALDVRPNEEAEPFIIVYLRIFPGDFDHQMTWPSTHECEMAVLSQDSTIASDIVEVEKDVVFSKNRDEYVDTFLVSVSDTNPPHVKDENSPYLKNDRVLIRFRLA